MSHRRTLPGCLGVLGELFTTDPGDNDASTVEPGSQVARVWLYPCLICDRLACPEPGEACTDCAALAAPTPRRKARRTAGTTRKTPAARRKGAGGGGRS